jgi:hypothetical protein
LSEATVGKVYEAISQVIGDLAELGGIEKLQKNRDQNYMFRGVDDVYNALAPVLAKNHLVIMPSEVLDRTETTRQTQRGGVMYHVLLRMRYEIVCSVDGSKHEVICYGEAVDSSDKATNKAFTAAWKYLCFQLFCIPTGAPDADEETHETAKSSAKSSQQSSKPEAESKGKAKDPKFNLKLTAEELEEFTPALSQDVSDAVLKDAGKKLYHYVQNKRIGMPDAQEIARTVSAKRSNLVTATDHKGYETMLVMFEGNKLITNSEYKVLRSTARSRLNLPLE